MTVTHFVKRFTASSCLLVLGEGQDTIFKEGDVVVGAVRPLLLMG